jgi:predicted MFS family arabinose efflux permease
MCVCVCEERNASEAQFRKLLMVEQRVSVIYILFLYFIWLSGGIILYFLVRTFSANGEKFQ